MSLSPLLSEGVLGTGAWREVTEVGPKLSKDIVKLKWRHFQDALELGVSSL